ncbi:MAG: hypothetical protein ACRDTE_30005 [Pseudonocardiaceae bacterium]
MRVAIDHKQIEGQQNDETADGGEPHPRGHIHMRASGADGMRRSPEVSSTESRSTAPGARGAGNRDDDAAAKEYSPPRTPPVLRTHGDGINLGGETHNRSGVLCQSVHVLRIR